MKTYTKEQIRSLQKKHGITETTIYDPDLHQGVPAVCFGTVLEDNHLFGEGQHLRPEHDLFWKMMNMKGQEQ